VVIFTTGGNFLSPKTPELPRGNLATPYCSGRFEVSFWWRRRRGRRRRQSCELATRYFSQTYQQFLKKAKKKGDDGW